MENNFKVFEISWFKKLKIKVGPITCIISLKKNYKHN